MEKIFNKPKTCDECNEDLKRLFLYCTNCNKYICYDCFSNHQIDHDYIPCKTLDGNKGEVLDIGSAGYGIPIGDLWPSHEIDAFLSSHHPKCPHAIEYFEKNNITFYCHECKKWLCLNCLDNHLDHGLMLHVGFNDGKELRQIDPNLYKSKNQLSLSVNVYKIDDENLKVEVEINNPNSVPLYDLKIMHTWRGLGEGDNYETIKGDDFVCPTVIDLPAIPPNEIIEIPYEINFSNGIDSHLSSIISIIRFKDVFLGRGMVFAESEIQRV
ncbi:B-box zinc finger protein [uncultured Methanobacterium sp.]|uniref:B-box zinc finger protein n=1 Tax=uncultured Methanobacterium sp. TaxID=176306 RepID=UPI002AA68560|nr:B-box zinc finger protein [uncultured Methanobacterium sp.]